MWQHVKHPDRKFTHTHTHTAVCWELRLLPTGGTDFMGACLPHPLYPSTGSGGRIRLLVQRRPGFRLAAACDLVIFCVCVCVSARFISLSLRAPNTAAPSRSEGVIYTVDAQREYSKLRVMCVIKRDEGLEAHMTHVLSLTSGCVTPRGSLCF